MLRALIIDDDPLACELLRAHVASVSPPVEVVAEVGTVRDAAAALGRGDYDLVFLDIQLIDGSGFDLAPLVRSDAAIVFVTGCDDHAVRAFEVNAVDYIVKPVTAGRLAQALKRIGREAVEPDKRFKTDDRIFLRGAAAGGRFVSIGEIVAIVSSENYSEVYLADGARWFVRRTMDAWEHRLPRETFARVHRTAIANLGAIERVERNEDENTALRLRGVRRAIPVSRRLWAELRVRFFERGLS